MLENSTLKFFSLANQLHETSFIANKTVRLVGQALRHEDPALCAQWSVDGLLSISTHSGGSRRLCTFFSFFFSRVLCWWSPVFILNDEILSVQLLFVRRMLVLCVKLREYGGVLYTQSGFHMLSHIGKVLKLRFG